MTSKSSEAQHFVTQSDSKAVFFANKTIYV